MLNWCRLIIWFHDHLPFMIIYCPTVSVTWRMALWEWLKYWLFVWDKFGFEKSHKNRNFGFDLLASVRFWFLKTETEPKFGFRTSLLKEYVTCLETTSGAIQYGVPTIVFRFDRSAVIWAQKPKSVTLTSPLWPSRTLSDFMSRWIISCKWKN